MVRRIGRIGRSVVLGLAATGMMIAVGVTGAQAQGAGGNKVLPGVSTADIISMMTKNKIQSQQAASPGNDPLILAMLPTGEKFFVILQGCEGKGTGCKVVRYAAVFTGVELSMGDYNDFNSLYVFGKAYQDQEKRMFINHAVTAEGGIHLGAIETNMVVFFHMAQFFTKFVSERMNTLTASADKPAGEKPGAITNVAGDLPANSLQASLREAAKKHPDIVNTVGKNSQKKWQMK